MVRHRRDGGQPQGERRRQGVAGLLFQDLQSGQPAPGEAEVQVYVNRGRSYIELESQGPYTLLPPGAVLRWTVRWYLMPVSTPAVPSPQLVEKARQK